MLALGLVGHLPLQINLGASDRQLSTADLPELRSEDVLDVLGPLRWGDDAANGDLVDHPMCAIKVVQPLQHRGACGLVGNGSGDQDLFGRRFGASSCQAGGGDGTPQAQCCCQAG